MPAKLKTLAVVGLDAEIVEVEADMGGGDLGSFTVVGLPDTAVSEARERVRSAIRNSGFEFPKLKVTVNLAPANLKKQGSGLDVPMALSILTAAGRVRLPVDTSWAYVGELALDGRVRPVAGVLPMALAAKRLGITKLFVPQGNAAEAAVAEGVEIWPIASLSELTLFLMGKGELKPLPRQIPSLVNLIVESDLAFIAGQQTAKRALEIAAAGGHNILMSGPPGSGKTMLAKALASILPDLILSEALEITKIYSVAGLLPAGSSLIKARPFRAPHHSASGVALVGGGAWPKPGEISLAHRGVLFLDELPEFPRSVLENLRQPLEEGRMTVSRASGNLSFPARFILAAAMNPCPCGFAGDREKQCICSASQLANYGRRLSGPLLDRIDLFLTVPRLEFSKLKQVGAESSATVKKRVEATRLRQLERFKNKGWLTNSELSSQAVRKYCALSEAGEKLMEQAVEKLDLSPRGYFRVLKIARTIADLAGVEVIAVEHLAEALQYRPSRLSC